MPTVVHALRRSRLPPLEARILLAHTLRHDRSWLAANPERPLSDEEMEQFSALSRRRMEGEPIAYLVGSREFYGLPLLTTPAALIPRPETELLVEVALGKTPESRGVRVLDLGTGNGAVALAIAQARPQCKVTATDRSTDALALAWRNAQLLNIKNVQFVDSDWYKAVPARRFKVIVSNPPYIAGDDQHLKEGDLRYEPAIALTPGGDGLGAIREIVAGAHDYLAPNGWLAIEHGFDQADACRTLFKDAGFVDIATHRDLSDVQRVTLGRASPH